MPERRLAIRGGGSLLGCLGSHLEVLSLLRCQHRFNLPFERTAYGVRSLLHYGLGPVSVLPEYQRHGIGKALIQEGLSRLKEMNAQGCCLVGHPDYYRKFGFKNMPELVLEGVPQEVFFALSFDGHTPHRTVTFHDGFKADGLGR